MSAIYGLVRLDGRAVAGEELETMRRPMAYWGPDGGGAWREGGAGLGQLVAFRTPEDEHEAGPVRLADGTVVTAAARLDNRDELCRELHVPAPERASTADGRLVALAYERWREHAPLRLFGDWSFAAWDPNRRRLFLARDHYGLTALYHHRDDDTLAFASSLKGLLALPHVPRRLDEMQLGRALVICAADGGATMYRGIRRVPTAHALTFDAGGARTREFWSLMDAPEVRLSSDDHYVERLLGVFTSAVESRLRARGPIATTLSAGLDSSAVTGLAARELGDARLTAYTSRPAYPEVANEMPGSLVDEWPAAQVAAAHWPNVDHVAVTGRDITPLEAIEYSLAMHDEPEHALPNLSWVHALLDTARQRGARALITGQMGNGGFSWPGDERRVLSALAAGDLGLAAQGLGSLRRASRYGIAGALWHGVLNPTRHWVAAERMRRDPALQPGFTQSVVAPRFAARIGLADAVRASGWDPLLARAGVRERRLSFLLPGRLPTGGWWHQRSAAQGIQMRDPTADARLLEFCVGVPEEQFVRGGHDRWLARRAVARLMPPEVAWNRRRGAQGADIAHRLRADAPAVSAAVARVAAAETPREYLDVAAVERSWREVQAGASEPVLAVLRGLNFGLFLLSVTEARAV